MKLRVEPKVKPPVTDEEYQELKALLEKARAQEDDKKVFFDLEKAEKPRQLRRKLNYVAEKEGLPLYLKYSRKNRSFQVSFPGEGKRSTTTQRISAEEAQNLILDALKSADESLGKSEVIERTGVSPSSWNLRIRELLEAEKVVREGTGRETKYRLT